MSAQERRQANQLKASNQQTGRLYGAIQDAVRQVIPFSKATSFLEEHLQRMRAELLTAVDDCQEQEKLR